MRKVRIYSENTEIEPKTTIQLFLESIGIPVELKTYEQDQNKEDLTHTDKSLYIYIISNEYMNIPINNYENTFLILKNSIQLNEDYIKSTQYNCLSDTKQLLHNLVDFIIKESEACETHEVDTLHKIVQCHISNNITLSTSLQQNNENNYTYISNNYINAIKQLENIESTSYYIQYCLLYYKYKLNLLNKLNNKQYEFNTDDMISSIEELLEIYDSSEQLKLLQANIHLHLKDNWRLAYDLLLDIPNTEYERGLIMEYKYCRFDSALKLFNSIDKNYKVLYEIASCEYKLALIEKSKQHYNEVLKQLNKPILTVDEIDYLYRTYNTLAEICKTYLYQEQAEVLNQEVLTNNYTNRLFKV